MLSFEEAQSKLDSVNVDSRSEILPLKSPFSSLLGRVLARPVHAISDQPPFDRATMDGYAVRLDGDRRGFSVVGTVLAGQGFEGPVEPGQAIRIMTGAPCPRGLTVVPVERTDNGETTVQIEPDALQPGKNIAWQGQDAKEGDAVLSAGCRLGPATLSSAAMAGARELECFVPPRVSIVTTGDEIGSDGPAGVRNSNGPLLEAFCASLQVPHDPMHAKDNRRDVETALAAGLERAEIVVTVGGVSMGTHDLVPSIAESLGFQTLFHHVAMKPGKPLLLAQHPDGTVLLGLPGNPVSVLATAHLFLAPLIGRFQGGWRPNFLSLPLRQAQECRGSRRLFQPAQILEGAVEPVNWNGSGDFYAAAFADGLMELPPASSCKAGEFVRFMPFLGQSVGETGLRPGFDPTAGDCC
ncbi:MAG: molybdopterin molybdotransferase MoeA [Planctomycetes bacterium]|nr:molybdopterin molybdotransferase MoeA [Planctomycetota bacterium]